MQDIETRMPGKVGIFRGGTVYTMYVRDGITLVSVYVVVARQKQGPDDEHWLSRLENL